MKEIRKMKEIKKYEEKYREWDTEKKRMMKSENKYMKGKSKQAHEKMHHCSHGTQVWGEDYRALAT